MAPSDSRRSRRPKSASRPLPSPRRASPVASDHLPDVLCPLPRRIERVLLSISSPSTRPSPFHWRVGIRDFTFEACSGFTHVTARRVAQPPKAAFVTRLRSDQLPNRTARQLPDLSTTIWVDSSSTGYPCLFGAHSEIRDCLIHVAMLPRVSLTLNRGYSLQYSLRPRMAMNAATPEGADVARAEPRVRPLAMEMVQFAQDFAPCCHDQAIARPRPRPRSRAGRRRRTALWYRAIAGG
jgi:hypothetical protein